MIRGGPELSNFSAGKVLVTERFEPLRAGDFALRAPSVSPLEHAKGRKALDPAKNAGAFFRNKKIAKQLIGSGADRPPEAESPIRASAQQRVSSLKTEGAVFLRRHPEMFFELAAEIIAV